MSAAEETGGSRERAAGAADVGVPTNGAPLRLVVVSAGASDPSSTAMLADRLASRTVEGARARGLEVAVETIDLRPLATEIAAAITSQNLGPGLTRAVEALGAADGVI